MKFEKKADGLFTLNVEGYVCPHPQIYTKKALEKVNSGDIIEVVFDNPSSGESIATMCDNSGNEIVEKTQEGGKFKWNICKA
jgi:tRNA 2-thiouridine synthesizing protein A